MIVAPKACTQLTVSGVANELNAQVYMNEVRACFTGLALIHRHKKTFASIVEENGLNFSNAYQGEIAARISDSKKYQEYTKRMSTPF